VPAPPPSKPIAEWIILAPGENFVVAKAIVDRRFGGWKRLVHIPPEILLQKARILPDPHALLHGCGIGEYDVTMAPVMSHRDSATRRTSLLTR
jgi:hypothetical protein